MDLMHHVVPFVTLTPLPQSTKYATGRSSGCMGAMWSVPSAVTNRLHVRGST